MSFDKKIGMLIFTSAFVSFAFFQNCAPPNSSFNSSNMDQGSLELPSEEEPHVVERTEKVEVSPLVANKTLTTNTLIAIFGPSVTHLASRNIAYRAVDYGGRNSVYDRLVRSDCNTKSTPETICDTGTPLGLETTHNVGLNIRREGWRLQTCHSAVKNNTMLLNALKLINKNATTASPPAVNEANVEKAFQLFFRGKAAPTPQVLDALLIVSQDHNSSLEKWRSMILSLCLSPHWQVL